MKKLKRAIDAGGDSTKTVAKVAEEQRDVKKLIVGKMTSLSRKQESVSEMFEDLGAKIMEESF